MTRFPFAHFEAAHDPEINMEFNLEYLSRRLNQVCHTGPPLELRERQEIRDMVELLIDCSRNTTTLRFV